MFLKINTVAYRRKPIENSRKPIENSRKPIDNSRKPIENITTANCYTRKHGAQIYYWTNNPIIS